MITATALSELGTPPLNRRGRHDWALDHFVGLGYDWYTSLQADGPPADRERLENIAVQLLQEHKDVLPGLNTLKRHVARVSFLPVVVETLWVRAFPRTSD